ncbi:DUF6274 family protein [Streptomyces nitrosporeus]|uniref:DUF6274 family protein n=1 Tax=Streptomyces nitrosporeus TaxID=28894 RepID=UPI0039A1DEDB
MATSTARHETRALLRAHLAAATGYRHLTRHCPICYRLLRLAQEPVTTPQAPQAPRAADASRIPQAPEASRAPQAPHGAAPLPPHPAGAVRPAEGHRDTSGEPA